MFAVVAARESHRIPVLLGGSGLAARPPAPQRKLAALLRPLPCLGKEVIARLRAAGEIDAGDLVYLDRIADR